jgi:hypothetical protein
MSASRKSSTRTSSRPTPPSLPEHVFTPEDLAHLAERDEPVTAAEADLAIPWRLKWSLSSASRSCASCRSRARRGKERSTLASSRVRAVDLAWSREVESWSAALREELWFKALSLRRKEALLESHGATRPPEL